MDFRLATVTAINGPANSFPMSAVSWQIKHSKEVQTITTDYRGRPIVRANRPEFQGGKNK